ncbi:hypothetical protein [Pararhizobium haloflavum]|uniref:hypothetical protein n=1 Tax=Pararhizobium haloflavum TaxID=2037914 RepID=UPI000C17B119|nr:hypothetical protein [Pararhizobium haloflavum]
MEHRLNEIDEMIVHEKMQVALEHQSDAWADGVADGIEPEILADAALATAMRETVRLFGEDGAEALVEQLKERILSGEFSPLRSVQ